MNYIFLKESVLILFNRLWRSLKKFNYFTYMTVLCPIKCTWLRISVQILYYYMVAGIIENIKGDSSDSSKIIKFSDIALQFIYTCNCKLNHFFFAFHLHIFLNVSSNLLCSLFICLVSIPCNFMECCCI